MFDSDSCLCFGPTDIVKIPNESIGKYLFGCLKKRHPDEIAITNVSTNEVLTYGRMFSDSIRAVKALQRLNINKNDCICIINENTTNFSVPVLAALYIGVTTNLLNPAYSIGELEHALLITKPKLILCCTTALDKIIKLKEDCKISGKILLVGPKSDSQFDIDNFDDILLETPSDDGEFQPDAFDRVDQAAFILMSSGTTGLPKGVVLTHENLNVSLSYMRHARYIGCSSNDTTISVVPSYHIFGLLLQLGCLAYGMQLIILPKFKPDLFLRAIEENRVTKLCVVVPLLLFLAKSPLVDKYDLSSLKYIFVGGAAVGKELQEECMQRLPTVTIRLMYGLTETCGLCTLQTTDNVKIGSIGSVICGAVGKVCDPESNRNLGPLEIGEMCFKGEMCMKEYAGNLEATGNAFDSDGFYHTGDMGYYDDDQQFYFVERLKELIKYKAFQVPPAEIEALILSHPAVKDCGVIGIPDERAGQLPLAYIVRRNAALTEEEVIQFVAERISVPKQLHGGVRFIDDIPRNATGKLLRRRLLEMFETNSNY